MNDSNVEKALVSAAKDFLTAGDEPTLPASQVAWENVKFKGNEKPVWASFFYRPIQPEARTIGVDGYDEFMGFIQIDLNVSTGTGSAVHRTWEDKARKFFAPGTFFSFDDYSIIVTSAGMGQGRVDGNNFTRSLAISYKSHVKRQNSN